MFVWLGHGSPWYCLFAVFIRKGEVLTPPQFQEADFILQYGMDLEIQPQGPVPNSVTLLQELNLKMSYKPRLWQHEVGAMWEHVKQSTWAEILAKVWRGSVGENNFLSLTLFLLHVGKNQLWCPVSHKYFSDSTLKKILLMNMQATFSPDDSRRK